MSFYGNRRFLCKDRRLKAHSFPNLQSVSLLEWVIFVPHRRLHGDLLSRQMCIRDRLSPPGKQKAPKPRHPSRVVIGSGAGLMGRWLRRFDIHNAFFSAPPAIHRKIMGNGVVQELQDLALSADRAHKPSVPYGQFIRFRGILQPFHRLSLFPLGLLQMVSRQIKDARAIPFSAYAVVFGLSSAPSFPA